MPASAKSSLAGRACRRGQGDPTRPAQPRSLSDCASCRFWGSCVPAFGLRLRVSDGTGFRPSQRPRSALTRSRAWRRLAISRAFSYSAKAPAICRIILREGSLSSVRSSPFAVSTRTRASSMRGSQAPGSSARGQTGSVLDDDDTHPVALDFVAGLSRGVRR